MKRARILPLQDWVPRVSPRYGAPEHLRPFTDLFERVLREPVEAVVSAPPRHGKTETTWHGIAWLLAQRPSLRIGYITYAQRFSEKKSRKGLELARRVGVPIAADSRSRADWRTGVEDGGVWATSINGPVTGEGFDLLIVDDPVKDRATAESGVEREKAIDWFNDVAFTRLEPGGSCIVTQTRWHPDDLAGQLIKDGWPYLRLPALSESGKALWSARFPATRLLEIREQLGEYGWSSLYQGEPRARGDQLFGGDVHFYEAPPSLDEVSIGCDLAYSERTHADYSVAVVAARAEGRTYILDVIRQQAAAPVFQKRLAALRLRYPRAVWRSYLAGTEKGVADVFASLGSNIGAHSITGDKFVRAQPVAAAWNAGKILLPREASWLSAFVEELKGFTGVKDRHDDQVDALAAAYDALARSLVPSYRQVTGGFKAPAPTWPSAIGGRAGGDATPFFATVGERNAYRGRRGGF